MAAQRKDKAPDTATPVFPDRNPYLGVVFDSAEDLTGHGGCRVAFVAMVILVTGHHLDCDDVTAGPGISGHTRL